MNPPIDRTRDAWIALRCLAGEPRAFEALIEHLERPLLYYLKKLLRNEEDALDVLQEVWLAAFRSIRRLDDPSALRPWIYRIAHHLAVTRIRRSVSEELLLAEAAAETEPDIVEDPKAIHQALDALDVRLREVLVLHFLEGMSLEDIAHVVGCPVGTVKSRMYFGKKALREVLIRGGYGAT